KDGIITAISKEKLEAEKIIDADGKMVLPGTVDPHVHIRAPGHDERETFESGTKDAALGGVTMVIEMPISVPPPHSSEIVKRRMDIADKEAVVDIAFFGAAGTDCLEDIIPCAESGIVAFKTFLHEAPPGRKEEFIGLTAPNTILPNLIFPSFTAVKSRGILVDKPGNPAGGTKFKKDLNNLSKQFRRLI
ncbi:unnamed protein product, partial [marine sediment metagenome]